MAPMKDSLHEDRALTSAIYDTFIHINVESLGHKHAAAKSIAILLQILSFAFHNQRSCSAIT